MSLQVVINRKWELDGVLTSATSVKLSSEDTTYGVKRNDTDAVVVADDTTMVEVSTGVYRYTFTAPAAGLALTAQIEIVHNGSTYRFEQDLTSGTIAGTDVVPLFIEDRDTLKQKIRLDNTSRPNTEANIDSAIIKARTWFYDVLSAARVTALLATGTDYGATDKEGIQRLKANETEVDMVKYHLFQMMPVMAMDASPHLANIHDSEVLSREVDTDNLDVVLKRLRSQIDESLNNLIEDTLEQNSVNGNFSSFSNDDPVIPYGSVMNP